MSRPPAVYRGNPFVIEARLAHGRGSEAAGGTEKKAVPLTEGEEEQGGNKLARVIRYANRRPPSPLDGYRAVR